jgi:hypothetical protein
VEIIRRGGSGLLKRELAVRRGWCSVNMMDAVTVFTRVQVYSLRISCFDAWMGSWNNNLQCGNMHMGIVVVDALCYMNLWVSLSFCNNKHTSLQRHDALLCEISA